MPSVTCEKQLSITTTQDKSLQSYWKFNETVGTRMDSKGTNHLPVINAAKVSFDVGVISNAVKMLAGVTGANYLNLTTALLQFGTTGFTFCGWYKTTSNLVNKPAMSIFLTDSLSNNANGVTFTPPIVTYFQVASSKTTTPTFGTVNTFHFFRVWVDGSTNTLNVKINEGATLSAALGFTYAKITAAGGIIQANASSVGTTNQYLDETGFWNCVLTDAEAALVYNGGAGQTYPNLPYA